MKHLISLFFVFTLFTAVHGQQNVDVLWERHAGTQNGIPAYLGTAYESIDIAVGTVEAEKTLYLIIVENVEIVATSIHKIDPETGTDLGTMVLPDAADLSQGPLTSATITSDGKLLVSNAAGPGGKFNVYLYSNNTSAPETVLSYTVPGTTTLTKTSVTGSYTDGTAKLYVNDLSFYGTANAPQAKVYVFTMKTDPNHAGKYIFDVARPRIVTFRPGSSQPEIGKDYFHSTSVEALPDETFFWMDTYWPLMHVDLEGNISSASDVAIVPPRARVPRYIGKKADKEYLAYFTYREFNNTDADADKACRADIYAYPAGNLLGGGQEIVAKTTALAKVTPYTPEGIIPDNIQADGGITIDRTGEHPVVYVLSTNQGIGAYRLKEITLDPLSTARKLYHSDNIDVLWHLDRADKQPFFSVLHNTRSLAFGVVAGNKRLYAVDTELTNYNVHILDPETGEVTGTLNKESVLATGSRFPLSTVAVTEDGVILATSMAMDAANYDRFYAYKWTSETTSPEVIISYDISHGKGNAVRIGDKMSVSGKISDGTAIIHVPSYGDGTVSGVTYPAEIARFKMIKDDADKWVFDQNPEFVPIPTGTATFVTTSVVMLPDNSYLRTSRGSAIIHSLQDGTVTGASSDNTEPDYPYLVSKDATTLRYIGAQDGFAYIAQFRYYQGSGDNELLVNLSYPLCSGEIYKFPLVEGEKQNVIEHAQKIAYTPALEGVLSGGYAANANAAGDIAINTTGENPIIYVLAGNGGIGAYEIKLGTGSSIDKVKTSALSVKAYQEGSNLIVSGVDEIRSIELFSLTGQKIKQVNNRKEITVSGLTGVYLLKVSTSSGQTALKIIIR